VTYDPTGVKLSIFGRMFGSWSNSIIIRSMAKRSDFVIVNSETFAAQKASKVGNSLGWTDGVRLIYQAKSLRIRQGFLISGGSVSRFNVSPNCVSHLSARSAATRLAYFTVAPSPTPTIVPSHSTSIILVPVEFPRS
jgi:hypothetical protein